MSGGDKLAELAAELLLRGVSTEKVLEIMQGAEGGKGAPALSEPGYVGYRRRVALPRENYVTHEQVLAALAAAKDLTIQEITDQLPGAKYDSVHRHVGRALMLGTAMQATKVPPYRYAATAAGRALAASPPKKSTSGRSRGVPMEIVLEAVRGRGPLDAQAIAAAVGGLTVSAVRNHMAKGMKKGLVLQHQTHPLSWSVPGKRAGTPQAAKALTIRGTPRVRAPSLGDGLKYEEVINRVTEVGRCTAIELHAALRTTASVSAVRQHLQAGVNKGLLSRAKDGKHSVFTRKGGTRARVLKPLASSRPKAEPGANDAAIVAAITAAGKPLDRAGFLASSELMRNMKPQSLYNALSTAAERGFIRRVGKGLYDLPKGKRGPKAGKPGAGGKDGPAKQQDLPLESAEKKPPNGANGQSGAAHSAPS